MDELYKIQNVTYNATGGTLKNDKAVIDLTAQQNRLLRYLVLNAGKRSQKSKSPRMCGGMMSIRTSATSFTIPSPPCAAC